MRATAVRNAMIDLSMAVTRRAAVARLGLKRRASAVPTSIHKL